MKEKRVLLIAGTMMLISIPVSIVATNHSNIFTSGTGIVATDNNRTFTLNTPLNIENGVGTLNVGTLSVYAPNCSALENGVARLNDGKLIIYCSSGFNENGYYYGFSGSNISEVSFTYNNNNYAVEFHPGWCGLDENKSVTTSGTGSYSSFVTTASNANQTKTLGSSSTFLGLKAQQVGDGFEDIYIQTKNNKAIDLYSLTITYSCK